jgi:predicted Ser/Thr protein kinase
MMVHQKLRGRVHVPEVYGWDEDDNQGFIYMELIAGDPLMQRWGAMTEEERISVCGELKLMARAWRTLEHDGKGTYIGAYPAVL